MTVIIIIIIIIIIMINKGVTEFCEDNSQLRILNPR